MRRYAVQFRETIVPDDKPLLAIEHAEPLRHIAQGRAEAGIHDLEFGCLLGQQFLAVLLRRHIFMGCQPSAIGHRLALDRDDPAVGKLLDLVQLFYVDSDIGVRIRRKIGAVLAARFENLPQAGAWLHLVFAEVVDLGVAGIGNDHPLFRVEQA